MSQIDLRRVDLNLLPVFDVLMEERHVSRAARRLGRTQSAVSHALDRLREQLGDPLLVRVGGRMAPSPFALDLMPELKPILSRLERVLSPRESFDPATSTRAFRIVLPDFWSAAVAGVLAQAARRAPGVSIDWQGLRDDSLIALAAGQIDLAVAPSRLAAVEGVQAAPLGALVWKSFVRRAHPALARWGRRAWLAYPHIVVVVGDRLQSPVQAAGSGLAAERKIGARVPNFGAVAPLLAKTDMIATLPALAMGESIKHYGLVALRPPLEIEPIGHSLYWSAQRANEPALKWLRETMTPHLAIPA
ncbi:MAG: LysR family transcriptional regulator [Rhizobiales bacterium]|nr:LysR family transcriptional regulator [Hyphomicrobiales bacterium]